MVRPKHLGFLCLKRLKTRLYFKQGIHFRTLNEIVENFESFGFTVSVKTHDWFDRCYSRLIVKFFLAILNPKFFRVPFNFRKGSALSVLFSAH